MAAEADRQFHEAVGRRIAELRTARGMTQERLAEGAGIAASYVAHIEVGGRRPTLDVLRRVAECLGVPVWRLVADERPSAEEVAWGDAAKGLAEEIRGLQPGDLDLLAAVARRFRTTPKPGKRAVARR